MSESQLTLTREGVEHDGRHTVVVTLNGEIVHRDALILDRADHRRSFIDALVLKLPAIEEGADVSPEMIEHELMGLTARRKAHEKANVEMSPIPASEPFPDYLLPLIVRRYVVAGSKARATDCSIVALPILVTLAACIGTSRKISPKPGWTAPAIMWGAVVARSGAVKSVGYDLSYELLQTAEESNDREFADAKKRHKASEIQHRKVLKSWERSKDAGSAPEGSTPPIAKRFLVDDQTIESIALLLGENPRGLYLLSDELRGFFDGMGAYSSGGRVGRDEARWLTLFDGRAFNVDRKTNRERIFIPITGVSVAGTIQPGTLAGVVRNGQVESGLLARLLLTMPTPRAKQWTDATLPEKVSKAMQGVIDRLKTLDHQEVDGFLKPIVLPLTDEARHRFSVYVNAHGIETMQHDDALAAAWSKLEGYALRFALVDHLTRWASGDPDCEHDGAVGLNSIEVGIELSRWFAREAERVYQAIGVSMHQDLTGNSREVDRLAEWLATRGGSATEREINRGPVRYKGKDKGKTHIEDDCRELIASGRAIWQASRKTRRIVLRADSDTGDGNTSPKSTVQSAKVSPATTSGEKVPRRRKKKRSDDTLPVKKRKSQEVSPSPESPPPTPRKRRRRKPTEPSV